MSVVRYDSVTKKYGDTIAVDDISFTVEDGEFAILLGPSGCGKTTTLRCLAGLTDSTSGTITVDGYDVTDVHPKNRDIAMVFQSFALYPHMNVRDNIGYPLKVNKTDQSERMERIEETAEMLEIEELLDRDPADLSGGQRQRVALGRAIIRRPSVFLMDEPLANLDAKLKINMRSRIKVLQRELGITTLYVTHDQEEAMSLGDKLIIMRNGNIQQVGSPNEVYHSPKNMFVGGFIGSPSMNFLPVEMEGNKITLSQVSDCSFTVSDRVADQYDRSEFMLGVRPQYFDIHTEPVENSVRGSVTVTEPQGDSEIVEITIGDNADEEIELTVIESANMDLDRNDSVWLTVEDDLIHGFDPDTGMRISESNSLKASDQLSTA